MAYPKPLSEKSDVVKIQRKDIFEFSSIARRELHDYYVYEINELYSAEKRTDKEYVNSQSFKFSYSISFNIMLLLHFLLQC